MCQMWFCAWKILLQQHVTFLSVFFPDVLLVYVRHVTLLTVSTVHPEEQFDNTGFSKAFPNLEKNKLPTQPMCMEMTPDGQYWWIAGIEGQMVQVSSFMACSAVYRSLGRIFVWCVWSIIRAVHRSMACITHCTVFSGVYVCSTIQQGTVQRSTMQNS